MFRGSHIIQQAVKNVAHSKSSFLPRTNFSRFSHSLTSAKMVGGVVGRGMTRNIGVGFVGAGVGLGVGVGVGLLGGKGWGGRGGGEGFLSLFPKLEVAAEEVAVKGLEGMVEQEMEGEKKEQGKGEENVYEVKEKEEEKFPDSPLWWVLELIAKDGLWWGMTAFFALAGAFTGMMIPKSISELLDVAKSLSLAPPSLPSVPSSSLPPSSGTDLSSLIGPAVKVGGLFALESFFNFCFYYFLSASSLRLESRMRAEVFDHLIRQDISQFDKIRIGEFISTASADVEQVRVACKESISLGLRNILRLFGYSYVLYDTSPKLTLALSVTIPVVVSAGTMYARLLRSLSKKVQDSTAIEAAMTEEILGNIRTVRSFGSEDKESADFEARMNTTKELRSTFGWMIAGFQSSSTLAVNGLAMLVFCYGGSLVFSGEMTVGKLTSFIMYANNMQRALSKLSILFGQYSKASGAGTRILQLLQTTPQIPVRGGIIPMDRRKFWMDPYFSEIIRRDTTGEGVTEGFGSVEFRGVSFRYPSRPESEVLQHLDLDLRAGTVTALVGMSGSGKSTIASLLQRFYDPSKGNIVVNGVDLKYLDPTWWRRGIGVVGQEPVLFSCSIAENIRYGNPDATMEEVKEAARLANCEEFISTFENGYDTLVGERGAQISGGQKQRIAIARAILRDPHILILDEATSALDAKSEEMVQAALDNLMKNRTVLVIAHRLSTVKAADTIVVLEGGKVLEKGNHQQLVKRQGTYAELVRSQMSKHSEFIEEESVLS